MEPAEAHAPDLSFVRPARPPALRHGGGHRPSRRRHPVLSIHIVCTIRGFRPRHVLPSLHAITMIREEEEEDCGVDPQCTYNRVCDNAQQQ